MFLINIDLSQLRVFIKVNKGMYLITIDQNQLYIDLAIYKVCRYLLKANLSRIVGTDDNECFETMALCKLLLVWYGEEKMWNYVWHLHLCIIISSFAWISLMYTFNMFLQVQHRLHLHFDRCISVLPIDCNFQS